MEESAAAHHMINQKQPANPPNRASSEDTAVTVGTAASRSYDCTICKRGFSTAQALGGHMNIHRKDRADMRQAATPLSLSSISDIDRHPMMISDHIPYWPYHSSSTLPRFSFYSPAAKNTYTVCFPTSAVVSRDLIRLAGAADSEETTSPFMASRRLRDHLWLFGENHHRQELLQLQGLRVCRGGNGTGGEKMTKRKREEEEVGLDLELRLGASYH